MPVTLPDERFVAHGLAAGKRDAEKPHAEIRVFIFCADVARQLIGRDEIDRLLLGVVRARVA